MGHQLNNAQILRESMCNLCTSIGTGAGLLHQLITACEHKMGAVLANLTLAIFRDVSSAFYESKGLYFVMTGLLKKLTVMSFLFETSRPI